MHRAYSPNRTANVAIFWDYENCALPALEPPYAIVNKIRRLAHQYGSVKTFKAYLEYPGQSYSKSLALRSELQSCGVSLIDCPHNGRKDVADKMMMVDMMAHAIDNPAPSTIVLISGDGDFVYAVSILSLRQYRVVLLAPKSTSNSLKAQADAVYNWPEDFLPELPPAASTQPLFGDSHPQRPAQNGNNATTLEQPEVWKSYTTPPYTGSLPSETAPEVDYYDKFGDAVGDPTNVAGGATQNDNETQEHTLSSRYEQAVMGKSYAAESRSDANPSPSPPNSSPSLKVHERERSNSQAIPLANWATIARLRQPSVWDPPSYPTVERSDLSVNAATFVPHPFTPGEIVNGTENANDESEWQTCSRAAKKRSAQVPSEFKPLVKVLKRQLAEGVVSLESSQLGQFLSQEVPRLSTVYERAGVARLKEYTALAAEQGIVMLTGEGLDGHNYIALHPAYRRKPATQL